MKNSAVVAACLVNSNMIVGSDDAERAVHRVFDEEFPGDSFTKWDTEIDDHTAKEIIISVGRASRINVKKFIEDLWNRNA